MHTPAVLQLFATNCGTSYIRFLCPSIILLSQTPCSQGIHREGGLSAFVVAISSELGALDYNKMIVARDFNPEVGACFLLLQGGTLLRRVCMCVHAGCACRGGGLAGSGWLASVRLTAGCLSGWASHVGRSAGGRVAMQMYVFALEGGLG